MIKKPLVSVVIPVYNTGSTMDETINSVLKQSYKNIEIIVVNDGSTDNQTIEKLNKLDKNIRIINQINKGLPAARNAGIASSCGEYIVCLDSDDCINKKYVKKVVDKFEVISSEKVAIISSYIQAFGVSSEQWETPESGIDKLKYSNVLPVASAFTKKSWELVGGYDESFNKGFEDWDFWLSIIEKGFSWALVKEPLFYYRRKKVSMITSSNESRQEINSKIISKHDTLYSGEDKKLVLDKMQKAELNRNNPTVSSALRFKKILSKNFLKRFRIFR